VPRGFFGLLRCLAFGDLDDVAQLLGRRHIGVDPHYGAREREVQLHGTDAGLCAQLIRDEFAEAAVGRGVTETAYLDPASVAGAPAAPGTVATKQL